MGFRTVIIQSRPHRLPKHVAVCLLILVLGAAFGRGQSSNLDTPVLYAETEATVTPLQFYGECQSLIKTFNGEQDKADLFCRCVRSGNDVRSFNNSPDLVTLEMHNFLPLTNRVEYPFGEPLKWASYLSQFFINSFSDSRLRLHTTVYDDNCSLPRATEAISTIFTSNIGAGIVGPACYQSGDLIYSFAPFMSMPAVSYNVEYTALDDRTIYSTFHRLAPTNNIYIAGFLPALREFGWSHLSIVVESGGTFQEGLKILHTFEGPNTYRISTTVPVTVGRIDPALIWEKLRKAHTRIIVVMAYQKLVEDFICGSFHENINTNCTGGTQYVMVLPSWFPQGWFLKNVTVSTSTNKSLHCSPEDMRKTVAYTFSLNRQFYRRNETEDIAITSRLSMNVRRWKQLNAYMSDHCYFSGHNASAQQSPVETDASLHDTFLMYYKAFKEMNQTLAETSVPAMVGNPPEEYRQLDERFSAIKGNDMLGLRWLFIYLLGKVQFRGLSGDVYFVPNKEQKFLTRVAAAEAAFWKLVNTSFPLISMSFTPSKTTRPLISVYEQKDAQGNTVKFGALWPNGSLLEFSQHKLTWPSNCQVPNDTIPQTVTMEKVNTVCNYIPSGLQSSLGCDGGLGFIIAICVAAMLLFLAVMAMVWRKWYGRKLRYILDRDKAPAVFEIPMDIKDKWELPRDSLIINRTLGDGAFGEVFGGDIIDESDDAGCIAVAVKALHEGATAEEKNEFLAEGQLMTRFDHGHIVRLIGFCTQDEPFYVVMELMMHGDLRAYLLSHRHLCDTGDPSELHAERLTSMVRQVASGLEYLASINFIHRDIAARNCMVTINTTVKIGDFGMARKVHATDYYRIKKAVPLPVRWMAQESLLDGRFTIKSDMWSFGVVVWEVITFGALPFPGLTNTEVIDVVREGQRIELPAHCPDELEAFIQSCWTSDPGQRLTAGGAVSKLTEHDMLISPCVKTSRRKEGFKMSKKALDFLSAASFHRQQMEVGKGSFKEGSSINHPMSFLTEEELPSDLLVTNLDRDTTRNPSYGLESDVSQLHSLPADEEIDGYMNTDLK